MSASPTFSPQKPTLIEPRGACPGPVVRERAQAEDQYRQRQHPEHPEERRMAMVAGERGPDLEVRDDGQVDQEAEDARADKVPEADRHQEVDGPSVALGEGCPGSRRTAGH